MSIVLLIDGYNVIAPVAAPGRGSTLRWLETERRRLLDRLTDHLAPVVRRRTCVVFDAKAAPPGHLARLDYHGMDVRFAIDYPEADDLLEELIAAHPAPRRLTVVSSDHRVQTAARRKRAVAYDSAPWLDQLLDGYTPLIWCPKPKPQTTGFPHNPSAVNANASGPPFLPPVRGPRQPDAIDNAVDAMLSEVQLAEMIRQHQK